MTKAVRIHGTCVAVEGRGALFRGAPGSGKSDLALRLIERGAQLVADDQVIIDIVNGHVRALAEPRLEGRIEVRGVGILKVPFVQTAPLTVVFDLVESDQIPRTPETEWVELLPGHRTRVFRLAPFEASAPDKVRLIVAATAEI